MLLIVVVVVAVVLCCSRGCDVCVFFILNRSFYPSTPSTTSVPVRTGYQVVVIGVIVLFFFYSLQCGRTEMDVSHHDLVPLALDTR